MTAFTRWGIISCMELTSTPSPECRYVGLLQRPDAAAEENAAEHRAVQQIVRANLVTAAVKKVALARGSGGARRVLRAPPRPLPGRRPGVPPA